MMLARSAATAGVRVAVGAWERDEIGLERRPEMSPGSQITPPYIENSRQHGGIPIFDYSDFTIGLRGVRESLHPSLFFWSYTIDNSKGTRARHAIFDASLYKTSDVIADT